MTIEIQSVRFDKRYTKTQANKWLKEHNIKPLKKVHITENQLRYRIVEPVEGAKFRTKQIGDGISFVFQSY